MRRRSALFVLATETMVLAKGLNDLSKRPWQFEPPAVVERRVPAFVSQPSNTEFDSLIADWVFDAIALAWTELEKQEAGFELKQETIRIPREPIRRRGRIVRRRPPIIRTRTRLADYNVLLAVMNLRTAERKLEFVLVDQRGNSTTRGFTVDRGIPLGVGTSYEVTTPEGYAVLAIKRVLKVAGTYGEVVYTPYSQALDVPIVRQAGYDYLVEQIALARQDLRERRVRSRVFPRSLVSDLVLMDTALALSIIEHVDPFAFQREAARLSSVSAMEKLAAKAVSVVGANKAASYLYSVSSAGARGLFQFIPSTYKSIREQYPRAGLMTDFVEGMADHKNAAKASLLLFDSDWSLVPRLRRLIMANYPTLRGMYLAAAYNGGAGRAIRAMDEHGRDWTNHVLPETRVYISKFRALQAAMEL